MERASVNSQKEPLMPRSSTRPRGQLSTFNLVTMAIISVDSVRNLPLNAQVGAPLILMYVITGICFFLPLIRATSELAVKYPITGGSYLWIEAAFGPKTGFSSIWMLWAANLIWYPAACTFIVSTFLALISPDLGPDDSNYALYLLLGNYILFWAVVGICCRGMEATRIVSAICGMLGTIIPIAMIIIIWIDYIGSDFSFQFHVNFDTILPSDNTLQNLGYFVSIMFSVVGIETTAMHAKEVKDPKRSFPKALAIAGVLLLFGIATASLALCMVLPDENLELLTGLMTYFRKFFRDHGFPAGEYIMGTSIIIGSIGSLSSWIIGLARGICVACECADFPKTILRKNKYDMPWVILLFQGSVFSIVTLLLTVLPNVDDSYWLLSTMTSQLNLLYYVILFIAIIKLKSMKENYHLIGYILPSLGIVSCLIAVFVGFLPPENLMDGNFFGFEAILIGGNVGFCLPLIWIWNRKKEIKITPVEEESCEDFSNDTLEEKNINDKLLGNTPLSDQKTNDDTSRLS